MKNNFVHARGLTLIELVVVLMVLIALAGVLLPQFSGMLNRTHTSAASTNFSEINKAITMYQIKTLMGYPNKLDVPVKSGNLSTLADTLEAGGPADMTIVAADANQVASLSGNGIKTGYPLVPLATLQAAGNSATFAGDDLAAPIDYTTGTPPIVRISDARAQKEFGPNLLGAAAPTPEMYVIFGLNDACTAIPSVMAQAPLHFDQVDPTVVYSRFFLVFAIPVTGGGTPFCRYVGSVGSELSGYSGHLRDYYSPQSQ